jgi:hypothetical protein
MWRAGVAALILATAAVTASAHDSFIVPPGALTGGAPIRLSIGSGEFPTSGHSIRPNRIARIDARAADTALTPSLAPGETALRLTLGWPEATPPHQNGVVVAVDLSPIEIDVGADEIDHYMDEIGAPADVVAAARAAVARDGIMRETYTKHLKLMACIAACDGLDPARPSGSTLEFVASDEAWRLLENGQPLAGQAVFVTTAARGRRRLTTDRQGRVLLPADTTGPVFLSAVVLTAPTEPGGRFTSEWAALTLDASVR